MAESPFKTWLDSLAALPGNVATGDLVAVIRAGVSYKADGSKFAGSGGGGGDTVSAETVIYHSEDFGKNNAINTTGATLRSVCFAFGGNSSAQFAAFNVGNNAGSGFVQLTAGNNAATNYANAYFVTGGNLGRLLTSDKLHRFSGRAMVGDTASTSTQRYTALFGFADINAMEAPYNSLMSGAYFRYSDDINSGKLQAVLADGTTSTVVDTGVTPNFITPQRFKILIDKRTAANGGTGIRYYIDGVLVATIPITSAAYANVRDNIYLGGFAGNYKRVGTGAVVMYVDYMEQQFYRDSGA